jgi:hypothetical protein
MERRGTLAKLVLNRVAGIVICAIAAGPITVFIDMAIKAMRGRALTGFSATLWTESLLEILTMFAMMAAIMSPMVGTIALGMYILAKLRKDGFLIATLSGALLGYFALTAIFLIMMGKAPGLNFDSPSNTRSLANAFLITSAISVLYWLISVRRERSWRRIDMQDELALLAME